MKYLVTVALFLCVYLGFTQSKSLHITEFSQNHTNEGILIDVRTPEEFKKGHLENALNVNWFDKDFAAYFNEMDKSKTIYVYCKKGSRSKKAQEKLVSLGFENVIDLEGGYDAFIRKL